MTLYENTYKVFCREMMPSSGRLMGTLLSNLTVKGDLMRRRYIF